MKRLLTLICAVVALVACNTEEIVEVRYLASPVHTAYLYSIDAETDAVAVVDTLVRGTQLDVVVNGRKRLDDTEYLPVKVGKQRYYALLSQLVAQPREVVQEKSIFVRTPASIISDVETSKVGGNADKGEELMVIDYDTIDVTGRVNRYKVRQGKTVGYVYGKYAEALQG